MIQVSAQVAVALMLAFLGMVFAFGRVLLGQFEKRLDERFNAQDCLREVRLKAIEENQVRENLRLTGIQQEVHSLAQLLPMQYVRREDWIRFGSQIDHKLDRLGELFTLHTIKAKQ